MLLIFVAVYVKKGMDTDLMQEVQFVLDDTTEPAVNVNLFTELTKVTDSLKTYSCDVFIVNCHQLTWCKGGGKGIS